MLALGACATTATLRPFATDGCSRFPDGTAEQPTLWRHCCVQHDIAYWQGGSYAQRIAADNALRACVAATGEAGIAALMRTGVLVGGSAFWPTSYRWGYGWSPNRGYAPLNDAERRDVQARMPGAEAAGGP